MTRYTIPTLLLYAATAWSCGEPAKESNAAQLQALGAETSDEGCDAAAADARSSKPHKITICHIPPGNPDNAHTINVSKNAKRAHLAHGDSLGGCGCPDDGGSDRPGNGGSPGPSHTPDDHDDGDQPPVGTTPEDDPTPPGDDGADSTPSTTSEPAPDDPTPPSDGPGGTLQLCDSDQTICDSIADCGDNQTCDATSGCCVDVYL